MEKMCTGEMKINNSTSMYEYCESCYHTVTTCHSQLLWPGKRFKNSFIGSVLIQPFLIESIPSLFLYFSNPQSITADSNYSVKISKNKTDPKQFENIPERWWNEEQAEDNQPASGAMTVSRKGIAVTS